LHVLPKAGGLYDQDANDVKRLLVVFHQFDLFEEEELERKRDENKNKTPQGR